MDESGAGIVSKQPPASLRATPTTQPVQPATKPLQPVEAVPTVKSEPILSPSVTELAPTMRPSFGESTAAAVGAQVGIRGEMNVDEEASPNSVAKTNPQGVPQPQFKQPAAGASRPGERKREPGVLGVSSDQPPPPSSSSVGVSKREDFTGLPIGDIDVNVPRTEDRPLTTLEAIELEKKQNEKRTKKVSQFTRRRRRADGIEYDGDYELPAESAVELDKDGRPILGASKIVTGERTVIVQIGTTQTRTEEG